MACHICGNNAIGLCRQCFKFYCQEHGEGFCSDCQQQGWELEQQANLTGRRRVTAASMVSLTRGSARVKSPEEQGTSAETEGEQTDAEKQSEAKVERAGFRWRALDQDTIESLTEPAKFAGILPIYGASRLNDVLMLLKGIDLYEEAFLFDLTISFGSRSDNGMVHWHPMFPEISIRDDVGTVYNISQRGGSGHDRISVQSCLVTPALNPEAKQLTLGVPRLQITEHIFRSRRQPEQIFLNGPWTITCAVPPPEERISLQ